MIELLFACDGRVLGIDGQSVRVEGIAPTFPAEHSPDFGLPLDVSTLQESALAGRRYMWLVSASETHRRYSLRFRFDDEPTMRLDFVLLPDARSVGVLTQATPHDASLPERLVAKANCKSDWTFAQEGDSE